MDNKIINCVCCGTPTLHDTSAICVPSIGQCIRIKSKNNYNEDSGKFCMSCALPALGRLEESGVVEQVNENLLFDSYFCGFISKLYVIIELPKSILPENRLSVVHEAIAELKTWPFKQKNLGNGVE